MLKVCHYTKFCEVNFKILAHILVIPKLLAVIRKQQALRFCHWCGGELNLEHILLTCPCTAHIRGIFAKDNIKLLKKAQHIGNWIFGFKHHHLNPIVWVMNFAIYKLHLLVCSGFVDDFDKRVVSEFTCYQKIFPILKDVSF